MDMPEHMHTINAASSDTRTRTRNSKKHIMNHYVAPQYIGQDVTESEPSSVPHTLKDRASYISVLNPTENTLASRESMMRKLSGRSSICKSPGWEDSNKRSKEKQEAKESRRREKERIAAEVRETKRPSRLTKAPPAANRRRELSAPVLRKNSASILHTGLTVPITGQSIWGIKSERSSHDAGSKRVLPLNSGTDRALDGSDIAREEGFIGGLKLRQATQALSQQGFRKGTASVEPYKSNFIEEFTTTESSGAEAGFILGARRDSVKLNHSDLEGVVRGSEPACVPITDDLTRGRTGRRPSLNSAAQTPVLPRDITEVSQETQPSGKKLTTAGLGASSTPLKAKTSERPPISYREPAELAQRRHRPRRGSLSSLLGIKQPNKDTFDDDYREEPTLSSGTSSIMKVHTRGRSWSFTKSSRTSMSRPTTADSFKSDYAVPQNFYRAFHDSNGLPTPPGTAGNSKENLSLRGNFSVHSQPQGLRAAAKGAFSRYLKSPRSSSKPRELRRASEVKDVPYSINTGSQNQPTCSVAPKSVFSEKELSCDKSLADILAHDIVLKHSVQGCKSLPSRNGCHEQNSLLRQNSIRGEGKSALSKVDLNYASLQSLDNTNVVNCSSNLATSGQANDAAVDRDRPLSAELSQSSQPTFNSIKSSSPIGADDLSFLPPLRHRTLKRPARANDRENKGVLGRDPETMQQEHQVVHTRSQTPIPSGSPCSSSVSSPTSSSTSKVHSARHLHNQRQSLPPSATNSRVSLATTSSQEANTRAKMFVICCNCRYFHDLPSKLYECMAKPDGVVKDTDLGVSGVISTRVKCPWCGHGMSTTCCEGWVAVVVMKERLH